MLSWELAYKTNAKVCQREEDEKQGIFENELAGKEFPVLRHVMGKDNLCLSGKHNSVLISHQVSKLIFSV